MLAKDIFPEKIERAFFAAVRKYRHRPEVTGIDVGRKIVGGRALKAICIRLHVKEKHAPKALSRKEAFPKSILGVRTDVIQANYERHSPPPTARTTLHRPLQPGVSIGHPRAGAGTLGAIVRDGISGDLAILSACHVLYPDPHCAPGDPIVQPGPNDGGAAPMATVAELTRADFPTDTAIALLRGGVLFAMEPFGTTIRLAGSVQPHVNQVLEKSGRSTGVTQAKVDGIGGYGSLQFAMRLVPLDGNEEGSICAPGDSGAVWYDPATSQGVGVHLMGDVGNSRYHSVAVCAILENALEALNASI